MIKRKCSSINWQTPWDAVPQTRNVRSSTGWKIFQWKSFSQWHGVGAKMKVDWLSFKVNEESWWRALTVPTNKRSSRRKSFSMGEENSLVEIFCVESSVQSWRRRRMSRTNIVLGSNNSVFVLPARRSSHRELSSLKMNEQTNERVNDRLDIEARRMKKTFVVTAVLSFLLFLSSLVDDFFFASSVSHRRTRGGKRNNRRQLEQMARWFIWAENWVSFFFFFFSLSNELELDWFFASREMKNVESIEMEKNVFLSVIKTDEDGRRCLDLTLFDTRRLTTIFISVLSRCQISSSNKRTTCDKGHSRTAIERRSIRLFDSYTDYRQQRTFKVHCLLLKTAVTVLTMIHSWTDGECRVILT